MLKETRDWIYQVL